MRARIEYIPVVPRPTTPPPPPPRGTLESLDQTHRQVFHRALVNVLSTDAAASAYAQIIDGLPTVRAIQTSWGVVQDHPASVLNHIDVCEGSLATARDLCSTLELSTLRFQPRLLHAFQRVEPGEVKFNLLLIDMVVAACYQVAANVFERDESVRSRRAHDDWASQAKLGQSMGQPINHPIPPCPFIHGRYSESERYPKGVADVVGYWVEGQIFGGVVLFDRGESDQECNAIWMSSSRPRPYTLYTPTHPQLAALSALLLAEPGSPGPQVLPIEPSTQNYPRWHPCDAFNWGHIFRDRFERKMRLVVDYESCVMKAIDRPQGQDEMLLSTYDCTVEGYASERVLDEEWAAAARERLKTVTPSARFGTRDGPAKGYC